MQAPPFKQGFGSHVPSEFCIKLKLHHTRGITLKRVTSGRAHLLGLAPAQHSCERTSQHWQAVGDTVSDLTGRKLKFDTSRTYSDVVNNWANHPVALLEVDHYGNPGMIFMLLSIFLLAKTVLCITIRLLEEDLWLIKEASGELLKLFNFAML